MGDGTRKPISQIKVGDKVLASEPETGKSGVREVTALWAHRDTLTDLVIDGETIRTTEDHPFWSVTDQMYEDAQDLAPGEQVLTADGRVIEVIGLDASSAGEGTAYNLTVDDIHTYYVGAGDVLVHNTNGCGSAATAGGGSSSAARGGVYSLRNDAGDVVRTGRSNDLAKRELAHANDSTLGDFTFRTEHLTDDYAEQRGLEQMLYDANPGAKSINGGFNKIRGISLRNPRLGEYTRAATDFLSRSE